MRLLGHVVTAVCFCGRKWRGGERKTAGNSLGMSAPAATELEEHGKYDSGGKGILSTLLWKGKILSQRPVVEGSWEGGEGLRGGGGG